MLSKFLKKKNGSFKKFTIFILVFILALPLIQSFNKELIETQNQNKEEGNKASSETQTQVQKEPEIEFSKTTDEIFYKDKNSEKQTIDTKIIQSENPEYDFMNTKNHFETYFKKDAFGKEDNVKFQTGDAGISFKTISSIKNNEESSSFKNLTPKNQKEKEEKQGRVLDQPNKFQYPKVYEKDGKKIDADYTITSKQLLEEFVLNEFQGFPEFSSEINLENVYPKIEGKKVNFYNKKTNELTFYLPEPVMYEKENKENKNFGLHYEVSPADKKPLEESKKIIITKVLNQEGKNWLVSKERIYPLIIDQTITYGSEYNFNTNSNTSYISVSSLDSTHFVVAYCDQGNSYYGTAIIGTVSGSAISYGSEYVFNSSNTAYISVSSLDSTHFVVAYGKYTTYYFGYSKIGTVSGSAISYGSEYAFSGAVYIGEVSASTLDSTHFVVVYSAGSFFVGYSKIGTVSGSTISYGSEYQFNSSYTYYISVSALDSTHFVVGYQDGGNSYRGTAIIGTVSGSTISYGSEYVFNSATTNYVSVSSLDSTHFVVAYCDQGNSYYGTDIIGTVSGSTISYGSEYVFNSANTVYISVSSLDSTHFVVAYCDQGNYSYGTARAGTVSGSTISYGNEYVFKSGATYYISISDLSSTQFVVSYHEYIDTGYPYYTTTTYGYSKIGTVTSVSPTLTQRSYRFQNDDGTTVNNNTNQANADVARTDVKKGERINVRIQIDNTGTGAATSKVYKLQYDKNDSVWNDVGAAAEIRPSWGLSGANGASITSSVCSTNPRTWANGTWHENTNLTNSFTLTNGYYTEFGFMVHTGSATLNTTYRFRLYNNTDAKVLDGYTVYPTITIVTSANDTSKYSKEASASLASNDADLTYFLDNKGYTDVGTDDSTRDPLTSSANYPVFLFKKKNTNKTDIISISWDGQSSVATSTNTVYLQMYNYNTSTWTTVNSNNSTGADTDFSMTYTQTNGPSNYYDSNSWVAVRVYQALGTQTLRTDYLSITFTGQSTTLTIEGVDSGQTMEGITTDVSTTGSPYSLNFGSLPLDGTSYEAASKFTISTNAYSGYTLTTQQNQDLTSGGDTISPVSGTNATPASWPSPVTNGAFGYHTSDHSLGTGSADRFTTDNTYAKFETTPYETAYSAASVTNEIIYMVYRIQVGALQPVGTYTNTITYILSAVF